MTDKPTCCNKPMRVNAHLNRVTGKRTQYICSLCGKTKTVKEEVGK
jgi:hypothetical protein